MQVKAIHRFAKISPFKAREITREIQGMPALEALDRLQLVPKKAAPLIAKVLKSAIANAEQNNNLRPESLVIKEAVVGEAMTIKRWRARARGSANVIRKRNSHLQIIVTNELPIERREEKPKKAANKASKKSSPTPAKKEALKETLKDIEEVIVEQESTSQPAVEKTPTVTSEASATEESSDN